MSKENGRSLGGGLREKGKALKRVALPAIQAVAVIGIIVGAADTAVNPGNASEIDGQIKAQVSEAYPRTVSEEQYKLAKKEIKSFDENFTTSPHKFIDRNTLSIKIPENVAYDIDLIVQENQRSKDASALKSQLKDQYSIDERREKRGSYILSLSLIALVLPYMARGGLNKFRKLRGVPRSPESSNS